MDAIPYSGQVGVEASILSPLAPVKQSGKYLELEGSLEDLETGEVVAKATGRFFQMPDGPMRDGPMPEAR